MNKLTMALIFLVIIVHLAFFVLEAIFWMRPVVYNILLAFLNNPVNLSFTTQALTLRNLFINQGFYNLFLVIGGCAGLYQLKKGYDGIAYTLFLFLGFSGLGAGIVLACSTKAYILALIQGVPAATALYKIYPLYKTTIKSLIV